MKSNLNLSPNEFRALGYLKTVRTSKTPEDVGNGVMGLTGKKATDFATPLIKTLLETEVETEVMAVTEVDVDGVTCYQAYLTEEEEAKTVLNWDKTRPSNEELPKGTKVSYKPHALSPAMKEAGLTEQEGLVIDWHFNEELKRYVHIVPLEDGSPVKRKIWKRDNALSILEEATPESAAVVEEATRRGRRAKKKVVTADTDSTIINVDELESNVDIVAEEVAV